MKSPVKWRFLFYLVLMNEDLLKANILISMIIKPFRNIDLKQIHLQISDRYTNCSLIRVPDSGKYCSNSGL